MNNVITGHGENVTAIFFRESFKDGTVFSCGKTAEATGYSDIPVVETPYLAICDASKGVNVTKENAVSR